MLHWIARFGVPTDISSDRGAQFTSRLWSAMAELLGIQLHHTTAYHPQANGLVERFHRHLKSALCARLRNSNWIDELPWVLLGIRTAPKEDLRASSAEMVYGTPLTVPADLLVPSSASADVSVHLQQLRETVSSLAPSPTSAHGTLPVQLPTDLCSARYVFVRRDCHRRPLQRPYEGPFRVLQPGSKHFKLQIGARTESVSIDRLKAAHLDLSQPVHVAQPPPRGRPRRAPPRPASTSEPRDLASAGLGGAV